MPDICMCRNEACPHRATCYRYTATPTPLRQTTAHFTLNADGGCDYYWPNDEENEDDFH